MYRNTYYEETTMALTRCNKTWDDVICAEFQGKIMDKEKFIEQAKLYQYGRRRSTYGRECDMEKDFQGRLIGDDWWLEREDDYEYDAYYWTMKKPIPMPVDVKTAEYEDFSISPKERREDRKKEWDSVNKWMECDEDE